MAEHLLGISPPELEFELQLNKTLTEALTLKNDSDAKVAYKVKTTAPKRYCVRPNAGVLGPKETINVEVLLQPLKELPEGLVCKDKFQVLSIPLKPDENKDVDIKKYWDTVSGKDSAGKALPGNRESEIVPQKLKCSFKAAGNVASNPYQTAKSNLDAQLDDTDRFETAHAPAGTGDWQKKCVDLERKHKEEIKDLETKSRETKGERDALVSQLEQVKKQMQDLQKGQKSSGGSAATSQLQGGPNLMLLGLVGIICAILGSIIGGGILR